MLGRQLRKAREEGVPIVMPSGNTFRLRPVSPETFLDFQGDVLDMLTPLVYATMSGDVEGQKEFEAKFDMSQMGDEQKLTMFRQYRKLFNAFTATCLVSPRVVPDGEPCIGDDDCWIEDIDLGDRIFLFQFLGATAKTLESFRYEQEKYLEAVHNQQNNAQIPLDNPEPAIVGTEENGDERLVDLSPV